MANYVEMWKDLGMDLENHDLLCQVLPTGTNTAESMPPSGNRRGLFAHPINN